MKLLVVGFAISGGGQGKNVASFKGSSFSSSRCACPARASTLLGRRPISRTRPPCSHGSFCGWLLSAFFFCFDQRHLLADLVTEALLQLLLFMYTRRATQRTSSHTRHGDHQKSSQNTYSVRQSSCDDRLVLDGWDHHRAGLAGPSRARSSACPSRPRSGTRSDPGRRSGSHPTPCFDES